MKIIYLFIQKIGLHFPVTVVEQYLFLEVSFLMTLSFCQYIFFYLSKWTFFLCYLYNEKQIKTLIQSLK